MKTIARISPIENAVNQTLSQWEHQHRSWGMSWSYQDTSGGRWEVAYRRDQNELHVYTPTGSSFDGLDRVIGFEAWRTDVDHVATPATVARYLGDLPGW